MRTHAIALAALMLPLAALLTTAAPALPESATMPPARAAAIAALDPADAVRHEIALPPGHALKGATVDGALVLSAVPIGAPVVDALMEPMPLSHFSWEVADCANDVALSTYWVPWNPSYPTNNRASLGQCYYERHSVGIDFFVFSTLGSDYGWADAYDYASGSYLYIECRTAGTCYVSQYGSAPASYADWDSLVGNPQVGTTTIEWH